MAVRRTARHPVVEGRHQLGHWIDDLAVPPVVSDSWDDRGKRHSRRRLSRQVAGTVQ